MEAIDSKHKKKKDIGAAAMENEHGISWFSLLPEGCVSNIISFTSPKDACRCSILSKIFKSAAESDTAWEQFLPLDYEEIMARSVSPLTYSSKKELYFQLSDSSILLDRGQLSFKISKARGKECHMLSAKELTKSWEDTSNTWNLTFVPESRFSEVAELNVCWLEIQITMRAQMLSASKSSYAAYFVFQLKFDNKPGEVDGLKYPQQRMDGCGD